MMRAPAHCRKRIGRDSRGRRTGYLNGSKRGQVSGPSTSQTTVAVRKRFFCGPAARAPRSPGGFRGITLRAIEPLAATAATIGYQSHDSHHAIQKALLHGAAHVSPTAHRTARPLPALSGGAFHAVLSVTSHTSGRKPYRQPPRAWQSAHRDRWGRLPRGDLRRPRPAAATPR